MGVSRISLLFFLLLSTGLFAQDTIALRDFNGDGKQDLLTRVCDRGSGFAGCDYRMSFTGAGSYAWSYTRCFCSMTGLMLFPRELGDSAGAEKWIRSVETAVAGKLPIKEPDPSLRWLIDCHSSYRQLPADTVFYAAFRWTPAWIKGPPRIPENYIGRIDAGAVKAMSAHLLFDETDTALRWMKEGLVYYYPQVQVLSPADQSPRLLQDSAGVKTYLTNSSVLLQKNNRYTWCFIHDMLFDGPPKLGLPSIDKAVLHGGLLFILTRGVGGEPCRLIVLDPELGRGAVLNAEPQPGELVLSGSQLLSGKIVVPDTRALAARLAALAW